MEQPDGTEATDPAPTKPDLCEDEEGWDECATDEELTDAAIYLAQVQSDLGQLGADVAKSEASIENHCDQYPEDCMLMLEPESSPQPLPTTSAEESDGELYSDDFEPSLEDVRSCSSSAGREDWGDCVYAAAAAYIGIDDSHRAAADLDDAIEKWARDNIRPTKRNIARLLGRLGASWIVAAVGAAYVVACVADLLEPAPVSPAMAR